MPLWALVQDAFDVKIRVQASAVFPIGVVAYLVPEMRAHQRRPVGGKEFLKMRIRQRGQPLYSLVNAVAADVNLDIGSII